VSLAAAVVDEVRRRMTARGMSQTALARAAGMPPTLLHRVMAGERQLQLDEVEALADALGVRPHFLIRSASTHVPPSGDCSESNSASASD
jgi:transcriptional regulator with XRE-family HTH domain